MKTATISNESLPLIVRLLESERELDPHQLEALREAQTRENTSFEELLIRRNVASEHDIAQAFSDYFLIPLFLPPVDEYRPEPALKDLLPEKVCRDHIIAPTSFDESTVEVVFFTPNELLLVEELQLLTGRQVRPMFAPLSVIEGLLMKLYDEDSQWSLATPGNKEAQFEEMDEGHLDTASDDAGDEVVYLDQPPPPGRDGRIIRYVNHIFEQALRNQASDVHIEPFEGRCRVRFRVDGRLNEIAPPPVSMYTAIVSRIKVLAKMDIAEKRLPQDGAITLRSDNRRIDMRVNTCPTVHGEKVVLRVLDRDKIPLNLSLLGLDERQEKDLSESIQMPHGLMLVTGPTGSGKSTTLYACLNSLNGPDVNICTVEDPVEYKFMGINQVQTKSQIGFTFADALRSFLRQDPDVIMVGEVRDAETAQICLRAALTGHFVLSTLHTNDALAAVDRLHDMEVEPFLLASTLRVVVAQRLVRRLCARCRETYQLDADAARRLSMSTETPLYRSRGCKDCRETGYRGRLGVFEVIRMTQRMTDLIQSAAPLAEMRKAAENQGMKLICSSAMGKVHEGLTSLEEALSITISDGE